MATDAYVEDYIRRGDVPAVAELGEPAQPVAQPGFRAVRVQAWCAEAPSFQLSWDQAVDNRVAQPMLANLKKVFLKQLDATGFVNAMVNVK